MVDSTFIHNCIQQYGLKPATQRELPLLTVSLIARGYSSQLREQFGPYYHAFGALGSHGHMQTLLNEIAIAGETRALIEKAGDALEETILRPVQERLSMWRKEIEKGAELQATQKGLYFRLLVEQYPQFMACIGVYNALWRAIGDGSQVKLSDEVLKKIGVGRDAVAKIYPKIEKKSVDVVRRIGEEHGFDGDLLRYRTEKEWMSHGGALPDAEELKTLTQRREKYFYLYVADEDREFVVSDSKEVAAIEQRYFTVDGSVHEVKGSSAFGGVVRGTVLNILGRKHVPMTLAPNTVLVASMTHPNDIALIKQTAAIVTDEGGILCHAAIISRELKIPCVVGTKIATKIFKNGDHVEVDAEKGVARKL